MPIHFIPLESNSSNDNAPLVWYEQLGVVACDNVLYCVPFIGNEEEKLALIAVDKFSVHHLPVSDLKARWPNDKFFINICFGKPARDNGHSRVPEPPHRITGTI